MAWAPLIFTGVSTAFSLNAASKSARAARLEGQRDQVLAEFQARQLEQNAGQTIAASQRDAIEVRRQSDLMESRAVAIAASSGGSVSDPTTVNLLSTLDNQANYAKMTALYDGEDKARAMRLQAKATRYGGALAQELGVLKSKAYLDAGAAGAFGSGASMLDKYGKKKTTTTTSTRGTATSRSSFYYDGTDVDGGPAYG